MLRSRSPNACRFPFLIAAQVWSSAEVLDKFVYFLLFHRKEKNRRPGVDRTFFGSHMHNARTAHGWCHRKRWPLGSNRSQHVDTSPPNTIPDSAKTTLNSEKRSC